MDDRELTFQIRGITLDFQEVYVQGVVTWRVAEPDMPVPVASTSTWTSPAAGGLTSRSSRLQDSSPAWARR